MVHGSGSGVRTPATVVHGSACGAGNRSGIGEGGPDPDAPRAVQAEPELPSPYPTAAPQGDQLARLRGQSASAWEPDRLVYCGSDCGLGCRAAHDPRRPALVFAAGHPDGADLAGRVPAHLRQTEGLIASIISLLGLTLRVPDHTTLSRRAATLEVPQPQRQPGSQAEALHLLVDSTGLKLCGAGEWLVEKHGTKTRRAWRKLHLGVDGDSGQIMASALTTKDMDDGTQVGPLLEQITEPLASFTGDGIYDQDD